MVPGQLLNDRFDLNRPQDLSGQPTRQFGKFKIRGWIMVYHTRLQAPSEEGLQLDQSIVLAAH
jgi:hypothetical protein